MAVTDLPAELVCVCVCVCVCVHMCMCVYVCPKEGYVKKTVSKKFVDVVCIL